MPCLTWLRGTTRGCSRDGGELWTDSVRPRARSSASATARRASGSRAITRAELRAASKPELPDPHRRCGRGLLPGVRRGHRRLASAQARDEAPTVRRHLPGRADAAVRDRRPDDQRGAALARPRPHLQHGRVRERGRRHGPALLAGLVSASDVGALLRPGRPGAAPARGADPLPDDRGDRRLLGADRGPRRRRRLLRRHRLVRPHRVLGVAPRPRVRRRPRGATSGRALVSSSCTR